MYFVYRMNRMIRVSVVLGMDSCFSGFIHGYGCSGIAMAYSYGGR